MLTAGIKAMTLLKNLTLSFQIGNGDGIASVEEYLTLIKTEHHHALVTI